MQNNENEEFVVPTSLKSFSRFEDINSRING